MDTSASLTEKQRFWQHHVLQAQTYSGSLADYAKQHQLKPNTLYYWVSVFKRSSPPRTNTEKPMGFSAVRVSSAAPISEYVLQLSSRLTLRCSQLPNPQWLATLCRALDNPA